MHIFSNLSLDRMLDTSLISSLIECWTYLCSPALENHRYLFLISWYKEWFTHLSSLAGQTNGQPFALFMRNMLGTYCSPAGQNIWCLIILFGKLFCILAGATAPLSGHETALSFNLYKCQGLLEEKGSAWTNGTGAKMRMCMRAESNPVMHENRWMNFCISLSV